ETRMPLGKHLIQVVQGNSFNHPCISDACLVGELYSPERTSAATGDCKPFRLKADKLHENGITDALSKALSNGVSVQVSADTFRGEGRPQLVHMKPSAPPHNSKPKSIRSVSSLYIDDCLSPTSHPSGEASDVLNGELLPLPMQYCFQFMEIMHRRVQ
ncbi:hypothetical protein BaRGS_00022885, partial [Batillaria attramentaria]